MNSGSSFAQRSRVVLLLIWIALPRYAIDLGAAEAEPGVVSGPAGRPAVESRLNVRQTGSNTFEIGRVRFDKALRTILIPAKVRIRNEAVEYALVNEQGKGYESLLTTDVRPADIHLACLLLGVSPVPVEGGPNTPGPVPAANAVRIEISWGINGESRRVPLASLVRLTSNRIDPEAPTLSLSAWLYNGSVLNTNGFAAQREGSIISLIRDPLALINNPGADRDNDEIHFPNTTLLPAEQTPVEVIVTLNRKDQQERQ